MSQISKLRKRHEQQREKLRQNSLITHTAAVRTNGNQRPLPPSSVSTHFNHLKNSRQLWGQAHGGSSQFQFHFHHWHISFERWNHVVSFSDNNNVVSFYILFFTFFSTPPSFFILLACHSTAAQQCALGAARRDEAEEKVDEINES